MDPLTTIKLLKSRRTKIVATLGPSSFDEETISRMVRAGVNVFRLNMSHGTQEDHRRSFERVRAAAEGEGVPVAVLIDLAGPKIRTGAFRDGSIQVTKGEKVTVTTRQVEGGPGLLSCQYEGLTGDVRPGHRILLDDGNVELRIESVEGTEIDCLVVRGGRLRDRTGMLLPGVQVSIPALTDKDRRDAAFALDLGVDLLALSFVRSATDIEDLRAIVEEAGRTTTILAKIETAQALEEIDPIIEASNGIMVARGDLGVEVDLERVPIIQGQLVDKARALGKPVIVATQMLDSMAEHTRPTRAEVADISNAVLSGTDALLLSRETAIGKHPVLTVEMMDRIARHSEGYLWAKGAFGSISDRSPRTPPLPLGEGVARATAQLSRDLLARCILVPTRTGASGAVVSSARPASPVIAVAHDEGLCRRLALHWGVIPIQGREEDLEEPEALGRRLVLDLGLARKGDSILMVRGFHPDTALSAPSVTVLTV